MAETLVIYDLAWCHDDVEYKDCPVEFGISDYLSGTTSYKEYAFEVQYPDNIREKFKYTVVQKYSSYEHKYSRNDYNKVVREQKSQQVINMLEDKGYYMPASQIALFMDIKLAKLIMQKNVNHHDKK
jgi:hypothetical protein